MTGRLIAITLLVAGAASCKRPAPEAPPAPPPGMPATIEVLKGGRWLFTYAEASGTFATTDKPESVPEPARSLVRVLDPAAPDKAGPAGQVYVTNLNEVLGKGKASARVMSREAFETAALAAFPTGESSPMAAQRMQPVPTPAEPGGAAPPPSPSAGGAAPAAKPSAGGAPVVTIYGTSWCGACRAARQYLTERKIPFADKDIERDADAAHELAEKAAKMGIPTDRVPVIDVRGRLLLGFDKARIEALLGEPT